MIGFAAEPVNFQEHRWEPWSTEAFLAWSGSDPCTGLRSLLPYDAAAQLRI